MSDLNGLVESATGQVCILQGRIRFCMASLGKHTGLVWLIFKKRKPVVLLGMCKCLVS